MELWSSGPSARKCSGGPKLATCAEKSGLLTHRASQKSRAVCGLAAALIGRKYPCQSASGAVSQCMTQQADGGREKHSV